MQDTLFNDDVCFQLGESAGFSSVVQMSNKLYVLQMKKNVYRKKGYRTGFQACSKRWHIACHFKSGVCKSPSAGSWGTAYPYLKSMCGASTSRTFWRALTAPETCSVHKPCPSQSSTLLAEGWRASGAAVMDVGNQHPPGATGFQKSEDGGDRPFSPKYRCAFTLEGGAEVGMRVG